jgi:3-oxoacyl-ACP reductase-like protein
VLLPLSPNHGSFGYDGLYAESKLGLESLLHKWKSEEWGNYLSIAGPILLFISLIYCFSVIYLLSSPSYVQAP